MRGWAVPEGGGGGGGGDVRKSGGGGGDEGVGGGGGGDGTGGVGTFEQEVEKKVGEIWADVGVVGVDTAAGEGGGGQGAGEGKVLAVSPCLVSDTSRFVVASAGASAAGVGEVAAAGRLGKKAEEGGGQEEKEWEEEGGVEGEDAYDMLMVSSHPFVSQVGSRSSVA